MKDNYDPKAIAIEYDRTVRPSLSRRFGAWLLGRSFIDVLLPAWLMLLVSVLILAVRGWLTVSFWEASGNSPLALQSLRVPVDVSVQGLHGLFAESLKNMLGHPYVAQTVGHMSSAMPAWMAIDVTVLALWSCLLAPLLLLVGLVGRFAALLMSFIAGMAYFGVPGFSAEQVGELLSWFVASGLLFFVGTGWFSWDFGLRQKLFGL